MKVMSASTRVKNDVFFCSYPERLYVFVPYVLHVCLILQVLIILLKQLYQY